MSVIVQSAIVRREFRGYDDPSLPIAIWEGSVTTNGNASAGFLELDLVTNPSTAPRDPNFYSLEHVMVNYSPNTSPPAMLSVTNLGTILAVNFRRWILQMTENTGLSESAVEGRDLACLPIFMGRQVNAGVTCSVAIFLPNVNGEVLVFQGQGYVWGPRSINAPGGPSRPLQGMF